MSDRLGYTTGTCAAAAAKAAALALQGAWLTLVEVPLPDGGRALLPVERCAPGCAAVRKDAGAARDITHGAVISAEVEPGGTGIRFAAGPGVGIVTLPGLPLPPGEPAITPAPRRQIAAALAEAGVTAGLVRIAVEQGEQLAARTWNPRLGIVGGLSILGSSGRVRPSDPAAAAASVRAALVVARASGIAAPVLVPGHHGRRAVLARFRLPPLQVVEVLDAWDAALDALAAAPPPALLAAGHPAKLVKLALGQWNTHVSAGAAPVGLVQAWARALGATPPPSPTIDGIFTGLGAAARRRLAEHCAAQVRAALAARLPRTAVAVLLTDLAGGCWGHAGDLAPWEGG